MTPVSDPRLLMTSTLALIIDPCASCLVPLASWKTRSQMSIAEEFRDHAIYFPYNMDFRGRTYPVPPNLNILGSDFCRGVLMFDEARALGERGLYWLKVCTYPWLWK